MLLTELLDAPYKFELTHGDTKGDFIAYFKDDSDVMTIVNFEYWGGPELTIVDFKRKGSFEMTNDTSKAKHEGVRIIGTVIAAIKKYVADQKPKFLAFSIKNSEESRGSLYDRLASKIAPAISYSKVTDASTIDHPVLPGWWKNKLKQTTSDHRFVLFASKGQS